MQAGFDINASVLFHRSKPIDWFEAQYNVRLLRPDFEETVVKGWIDRSEQARAELAPRLDVRYGPTDRQVMDVFASCGPNAPTLFYIHGGYWFSGDKSVYSFLGQSFAQSGINLVLLSYDLCPTVRIADIVTQIRSAIKFAHKNGQELGISKNNFSVSGHSAGGHLTQVMCATDWAAVDPTLPKDLVSTGIAISPLSILDPVRRTPGLNSKIKMAESEAEEWSPIPSFPPKTPENTRIIVGGSETDEFLRQANAYCAAYLPSKPIVVEAADHFDVVTAFGDIDHAAHKMAVELIRKA